MRSSAEASAAGILWVNSAGNRGQQHWSGAWSDPDGNNSHNFFGADEGNSLELYPDEEICGYSNGMPGRRHSRISTSTSSTTQTG